MSGHHHGKRDTDAAKAARKVRKLQRRAARGDKRAVAALRQGKR